MSNSKKMTLEEKLVERIKSDTLMAAVGDEDMLNELVKRALHEALFQERTVKDGYYRTTKEASLVVTQATKVAQDACDRLAAEMFAQVMQRDEVRKAINDAMPNLIVNALHNALAASVASTITDASFDAEVRIREAIRNETQ